MPKALTAWAMILSPSATDPGAAAALPPATGEVRADPEGGERQPTFDELIDDGLRGLFGHVVDHYLGTAGSVEASIPVQSARGLGDHPGLIQRLLLQAMRIPDLRSSNAASCARDDDDEVLEVQLCHREVSLVVDVEGGGCLDSRASDHKPD